MTRHVLFALLIGLLLTVVTERVEAGLPERLEVQIEKSRVRAEALYRSSNRPILKTGAFFSRMLHLQDLEKAWLSYQSIDVIIREKTVSRDVRNALEWDAIQKQADLTWQLWKEENRLRSILLRDAAFGMLAVVLPVSGAAWLALPGWAKRKGKAVGPSSRLAVTPDQPLDFLVRFTDPKETRLYRQAAELGFLSSFVEKILSAFASSPDQPASLSDHLNVQGGLIEHTARTVEAIVSITKDQSVAEKKLCYLMALCHDLGKLFTYRKEGAEWVDRRLPHDRISALIVAGFPEFYSEFSPTDRAILLHALRYYHNPEELPTSAPPASYPLMEWMRQADAVASDQEKEISRQQVSGIKPYLWDAFLAALPEINVNRYQGGYPEGFTAGEIVFFLEHALRERTLDRLSEDQKEKLPIRRPAGRLHPAWPLLVEVLKDKGILVEEVAGKRANPSALFNIVASGTTYKCVVALSTEALTALAPDVVGRWKQCTPYEIRIAGGRYEEEPRKSG